eukprot:10480630-Alexandrium_andersonii.AAC.1
MDFCNARWPNGCASTAGSTPQRPAVGGQPQAWVQPCLVRPAGRSACPTRRRESAMICMSRREWFDTF